MSKNVGSMYETIALGLGAELFDRLRPSSHGRMLV